MSNRRVETKDKTGLADPDGLIKKERKNISIELASIALERTSRQGIIRKMKTGE